ncbi:MAG: hypothetical protein QOE41_1308 [Mycobacterium sp.]|jgi:hypothetical protein|nr:hypothetical protein [Mycobacterium sp.]MDT5131997.1 hypothetical protein [Mycobacterium sp.]
MMRTLFATSCLAGIVITGAAAAPAYAGPPGKTCQNTANSAGQLSTPGHSGSSPGSVFNEPGFGSQNGGTGGNAYNAAGAPSQYDVACFNNQSGALSPPSAPASTAPTTNASSSSMSSSSAPATNAPTTPTTAKTGHTSHGK